jgi:hypothetical protein
VPEDLPRVGRFADQMTAPLSRLEPGQQHPFAPA